MDSMLLRLIVHWQALVNINDLIQKEMAGDKTSRERKSWDVIFIQYITKFFALSKRRKSRRKCSDDKNIGDLVKKIGNLKIGNLQIQTLDMYNFK